MIMPTATLANLIQTSGFVGGEQETKEVMDYISVDVLTISENGVREGLFFEQFWSDRAEPIAEDITAHRVITAELVIVLAIGNTDVANRVRMYRQDQRPGP